MGETGNEAGEMEFVKESEWVCEMVLWVPWVHVGDLQALTDAHLICIDCSEFQKTVEVNKYLWLLARKYAATFVQSLNKLPRDRLTDLMHREMPSKMVLKAANLPIQTVRNASFTSNGRSGISKFFRKS